MQLRNQTYGRQQCRSNVRLCIATFDFVERIVRLAAFDTVASTLLLVWTGLPTCEN